MKKLSICIPTYKRSSYLDGLLSSLTDQVQALDSPEEVEILVSDNCSPDATGAVAAKYGSHIRYWRNIENIGPDANFLKLFSEAEGEYIWLPGDDDTVRNDTVAYLLMMIENEKFDYLYLKTSGLVEKPFNQRGAISVVNYELLEKVNIFTTFMTSQVIRSKLIKVNLSEARNYLGGFMAYYWLFLEALHSSKVCLISGEREVYPEGENTGGYRFYNVWAVAVFDILNASSFGNQHKIISYIKYRMFMAILMPVTFTLRTGGSGFRFQDENPMESLKKYFGNFWYRIISRIYLTVNTPALRIVHFFFRAVGRIVRGFKRDVF